MNNNLGNFIFNLRKKKNISQEELASYLNVSVNAVSKWERGVCMPKSSKMKDIARALGVSVKELENGQKKVKKINYYHLIITILIAFYILLIFLLFYNKEYYYKISSLNDKNIGNGFIYTNKDYEELYIYNLECIDSNIKGYDFSYTVLFDNITLLKNNINDDEKTLISLNEYLSKLQLYYKNEFLTYLNKSKGNLDKSELKIIIGYIDEENSYQTYEMKFVISRH